MDIVSYSVAAKQKQRIEQVIANPDSTSGIVTTPSVIAVGETINIPAGRMAVLPNTTVNGTLVVDGEVFIPSGSSFSKVVETEGNQSIDGVKTFSSSPIVPTPTTDFQVSTKKYVDDNKTTVISASTTAQGIIEIATNAEVQAGTDTVRAITPAGLLSVFASSKAANGYTKLANGLIIQWGTGSAVVNGNSTVTFPITFPNACLNVVGTPFHTGVSDMTICTTVSSTASQAVFFMFCTTNGNLAVAPKWIAIGY